MTDPYSTTATKRTKVFRVRCVIRCWEYSATVRKSDGKVLQVEAGCRHWPSFFAAKAHYSSEDVITSLRERDAFVFPGEVREHARWSDAWIASTKEWSQMRSPRSDSHVRRWAERLEARTALDLLECMADTYAIQCRERKRNKAHARQIARERKADALARRRKRYAARKAAALRKRKKTRGRK